MKTYNYTHENIVTGYHQVTQGELDARGGYVFAHPGTHPGYAAAPHEPVSLMWRPIEDVYCMTPQAPLNGVHRSPDIYDTRVGPFECRRDQSPTQGHPPAIPYMPQWDAASHDPPSSVPRACWPPTTGPAYTPPAPVPAPSVSEAYFFWPSAFDTSQGGHHHEAPTPWDRIGSCTLPEVPPPMQFSAPPPHPYASPQQDYYAQQQQQQQQQYQQQQQQPQYGAGYAGYRSVSPQPMHGHMHGRSPSPQPMAITQPAQPPQQAVVPPTRQYTEDGRGVLFYVKALYDYNATIPEEFDFQAGDIIAVTATPEDGWWSGELLDEARRIPGRHIFPSNFVSLF
ncbi:hypothetical protein EVG20_g3875 [Dentipellis fragilis]|uniref:SH3 domain-containing protein n=1 Tax=Dentipellis fragilis TaxID=205917 RepID=A0A4Y9Z134_9AGAM|nr:hypothetical protein EVG20_g3875 [Dentipellis fragilis]